MWSGLEKDRESAKCYFCDTDFVGTDGTYGGKYRTATSLLEQINDVWNLNTQKKGDKFVILTGGEPLLQLDKELISELKKNDFFIAVETNGTIKAPDGIDWLTVSPKPNSELIQTTGDELKLVFPHEVQPKDVESLEFTHFFLSPLTENDQEKTLKNSELSLAYCLNNPKWRLTLQYHKYLGIR